MLYRIIGPSGSGKTEELLAHLEIALAEKKKCYFIVPEQQSVDYESIIVERFGDVSNLYCEVLNFERLPNRVAREFGGLATLTVDKGGACALLSLVAESLKNRLLEYGPVSADADFAESLYSLISRMKMSLVTPEMIRDAVNSGGVSDSRLVKKLSDIALIYEEYGHSLDSSLSDPRDALTVLGDELDAKPFFNGTTVFIDGYYTFTEQEYSVLKSVMAQCDDIYITLMTQSGRTFFAENDKCAHRLEKLSKGRFKDIRLDRSSRAESPLLRHLEANIWSPKSLPLSGDDGSVKLINAKNRFDEVEAAASEILSFVRAGGRYRDITVLAGNVDSYSAIVDSVFSRAEIPCYLSAKEPLALKPLFAFLLSSLAVVNENFSLSSMKRYIKSGYTDLTVGESDALLSYASSWRLRGKAWYADEDWTLNPDGYVGGDLSPRAVQTLALANRARHKIIPALSALRDTLSQKSLTVSSAVRALFMHMMSCSADEKLRASAECMLLSGDREGSERELSLWKLLVGIIDQLDSVCGDRSVTPKRLMGLIKLMCDCYSLGAIPPSADSVTYGATSLIRAGGSRLVIVLGVCDGEFPGSTGNGFFNRVESTELESVGINLGETVEKSLNVNRFFVYTALAAPTERLVLIYPHSEISGGDELHASSAWLAVKKLLPDVKETELDDGDFLYSRESVAAAVPAMKDCALKDGIARELASVGTPFFAAPPSVTERESRVELAETEVKLSPSKFERYVLCPFSYYAEYVLGLREKKEIEFASADLGTFAHSMLEELVRSCVVDGRFVCPTDSERESKLDSLAEAYFSKITHEENRDNKRFLHTFENMKKTVAFVAKNLCDELSGSRFVPVGYEYRIGLADPDIPAIEYPVDDKLVKLRGSIDRVDTYTRDGVTYARVIDYKTYDKKLSLDMVDHGLDTQLLHYLFAYCEKTGAKPAGVLYYPVVPRNVPFSGSESEEDIEDAILKESKPAGLLLEDMDIIRAMDPELRFLPVRISSKGEFYKNSRNLVTETGFGELKDKLTDRVTRVGRGVFSGVMDISPNDCDGKEDPCKFCIAADFCRNAKKSSEEGNDETD